MPPNATDSALIDNGNIWKRDVIQKQFLKEDVEAILSIPLPRRKLEDKIIWHHNKQGEYTVKSGYQVALSLKFLGSPSCSDNKRNNWSVIWKLTIPEKIKIFIWKAAQNLLPTADNLWKRKVIQEAFCKQCGERVEHIMHALILCKAAKKVWQRTSMARDILDLRSLDILEFLTMPQQKLCREDLEVAVSIFWMILYARNKFIFEGLKLDPNILLAKAEAVTVTFRRSKVPDLLNKENSQKEKQNTWTPPPQDWLKINVDPATSRERQCAGLGVAIRNHTGKCIAAAIKNLKFRGDVLCAEAEAAEGGLFIAKEADLKSLMLETDSQVVVNLINQRKDYSTEIVWTVTEIQAMKKLSNSFEAKYVPRPCKIHAHAVAKLALEQAGSVVWWGDFPTEIMRVFNILNQ